MEEADIYAKLATDFYDVFDDDSINVTSGLSAGDVDGWDSLTHIRLMVTVKKAFKSSCPPRRSESWKMSAILWRW